MFDSSMATSIAVFPIILMSWLAATAGALSSGMLFHSCSGDLYAIPSPYYSNLRQLLGNLLAATPASRMLFSMDSIGPRDDPLIYGMAQCRADVSETVCADCLASASLEAVNGTCHGIKSTAIRMALCVLRYADYRFFTILEGPLSFITMMNEHTTRWKEAMVVRGMIRLLISQASVSEQRIAAGQRVIDSNPQSPVVYGMAWCVMDLTPQDCSKCLETVFDRYDACCFNRIGGGSISTSCIVTYDRHPILNATRIVSPFDAPQPSSAPQSPPPDNGEQLSSPIEPRKHSKLIEPVLIASMSLAILTIALLGVILIRRRWSIHLNGKELDVAEEGSTKEPFLINLTSLKAATNNFSDENKLREGRFGPIYKGTLLSGKQIMVKRLTQTSTQDLAILKNEAALVSQLQHKNLVNLMGCCLQENEKLLLYEYLPNASLDKYLFDATERARLDWNTRHAILEGIARGLFYLHDLSRLRVIHRDLNASNILLDDDMNPRISEFGLAKLVGFDQSQFYTEKIAGTSGYMAPEYAWRGAFSHKSDVFSYGMLVLEVVTGRRNGSFIEMGNSLNLQTYVWQHWVEGTAKEVIDDVLGGMYALEDVLRCLNIGLLCIQAEPAQRPTMASALLMLSGANDSLPAPALPGYFTGTTTRSHWLESQRSDGITETYL
ncbi:hypothetical protein HPP92_014111 [Vanilla planifolia]|uniref:Uncharacterized protein n=1 Tax=Vanilla planifolia TaxID=51239 RepID=A0A835QW23_VANPL|nr:hypothetical protein HPP92_014111 [Vanilla planifolia]